jgi:hypothetical protein
MNTVFRNYINLTLTMISVCRERRSSTVPLLSLQLDQPKALPAFALCMPGDHLCIQAGSRI